MGLFTLQPYLDKFSICTTVILSLTQQVRYHRATTEKSQRPVVAILPTTYEFEPLPPPDPNECCEQQAMKAGFYQFKQAVEVMKGLVAQWVEDNKKAGKIW